ncbi:O-methyltransferase [Streptomyces sp. URMC 129]|uniref:O-methyltransferase n=1 Tax=Streptomyces sp. URMC 129 TaxID=3423407 RepID=UPI003F1C662D
MTNLRFQDTFRMSRFTSRPPERLPALLAAIDEVGFDMSCTEETGRLLRFLASTKPGGRVLEIGTGAGVGAAWLLDGLDGASTLLTIEQDEKVLALARKHLAGDPRVTFRHADAGQVLREGGAGPFDLIFSDAVPGKYELVDEALALLAPGGVYVIDDMLPQDDWPEDHYPLAAGMVDRMAALCASGRVTPVGLHWSTGLVLLTRD